MIIKSYEILKKTSNFSNYNLFLLYGDLIKIELISKNSKIYSMKYETESCVYCEASASLLAKNIKDLPIKNLIEELDQLKSVTIKNFIFSKKFLEFKSLINQNNVSRFNCIFLPIDAVLKALK